MNSLVVRNLSPDSDMNSGLFRHKLVVAAHEAGQRLDVFLLLFPFTAFDPAWSPSRSILQKWIAAGHVTVNGEARTDKSYNVREGDRVILQVEAATEPERPPAESLDIPVVHVDRHFVVIDKPPGISSHPVPSAMTGSVVNFLYYKKFPLPPSSHPFRPGIVHRLDKFTSGLMVIACTDIAQKALIKMIKTREVQRNYIAIVFGSPPLSEGTVEVPVGRHPVDRRKMGVMEGSKGKPARTHYRVITRYPGFSLVGCKLDTGRTHQIRVHMSHLGYSVVGDPLYGGRGAPERVRRFLKSMKKGDPEYSRIEETLMEVARILTTDNVHLLHAAKLAFPHPATGEIQTFTAEPHEKFRNVLNLLETLPHEEVAREI